jgi:FkbM family methyltransferase
MTTPARHAWSAGGLAFSRLPSTLKRAGRVALLIALASAGCRRAARPHRIPPNKVDLPSLRATYGEALYSQDDEETLIRAFFADRRGGFFLDVGAGDPVQDSTTYYLEEHLGWHGIAVDANADHAAGYEGKRPGTRFFALFAGEKSSLQRDFFVAEDRRFSSGDGTDPRGGPYRRTTVDTVALGDLLARERVSAIDFLSMDIEGAEPAALRGLDLRRFPPELAMVEIGSPAVGLAVAEQFALAGCREITAYRVVDAINRYYTCR